MEFFKQNTHINFMRQRRVAYVISIVLFVASMFSLGINHLNLGLDFTGGMQIEVHAASALNPTTVRETLVKAGYAKASAVQYGSASAVEVTIGLSGTTDPKVLAKERQAITNKITQLLPGVEVSRVDYVGPKVGKQLAEQGVLAILVSLIFTTIYIALRFEFRFAVSAAIALIHDPILILGVFSFFHLSFDLIALAALLTVIGYSLNDTVVIFDRVRENFLRLRKLTPVEVMNRSINQTLSRTIMTSGLTLIVVVVLLAVGGEMLQGFSIALIIGIGIGTYSSIYVAGALAIAMGLKKEHLLPTSRQVDTMP